MSFRLGVLFRVTGRLALDETPRRTIEFVVMGTGAIRDIGKSELEVVIEGE